MGILFEVVAVTGEYKDGQGETRKRKSKIGVVIETPSGPRLRIDTTPLNWSGEAWLNEPRERSEAPN